MSKHWSVARLASAAMLGAWAGLFWFLRASGRSSLYLSDRTDWVITVGAIILTIGALGRAALSRTSHPEPFGRRHAAGIALIVLPVVVVLASPPASLGSYAASRRSSLASASFVTAQGDLETGELTFAEIGSALRSQEGVRALARRAGSEVRLIGFVAQDEGAPADEFNLTRFLVSCCAADALSVQVRVIGATPGLFKVDEWVEVTGRMYPLGNEVIVDASDIEAVPRPEDPYLSL